MIGFIGQGWIGKHLADNFDKRGYVTIRYAKEPPHNENLDKLAEADVIFVAVPMPTTPTGFDDRILRTVLAHAQKRQIVVIKSTVLPGTTDSFSKQYPDLFIFHAPEFLRETSVKQDVEKPERNIVGIPSVHFDDPVWQKKAQEVLSVLPFAPYNVICTAPEAELTKYGGNNFLYMKVVFMNTLYDLAEHHGARWDVIAKNMTADSRIGTSHMQPVHQHDHMIKESGLTAEPSAAQVGRGAGGHCFIKDFAAYRAHYEETRPKNKETHALLRAFEVTNNELLRSTNKDLDLLQDVYGDKVICVCKIVGDHAVCVCDISKK